MRKSPFAAAVLAAAVLLSASSSRAFLEGTAWFGDAGIRYGIPGVGSETVGYAGAALAIDAGNGFVFVIPGLNTYTGTVDVQKGRSFKASLDAPSLDLARQDMADYALTVLDQVDIQSFTASIAGKISKDGQVLLVKLKETGKGTGSLGGRTRKGAIKARGVYVATPD